MGGTGEFVYELRKEVVPPVDPAFCFLMNYSDYFTAFSDHFLIVCAENNLKVQQSLPNHRMIHQPGVPASFFVLFYLLFIYLFIFSFCEPENLKD